MFLQLSQSNEITVDNAKSTWYILFMEKQYIRIKLLEKLKSRITGDINLIQAVIGPRQVGKTTLALQLFDLWKGPKVYETADMPILPTAQWIADIWEKARALGNGSNETLLIFDEIQKITRWSESVKRMFDEDRRFNNKIRIVLLGSSSLMMQKGLTESLSGRFEVHTHSHWSFSECHEFFGLNLDEYLFFGGYPGALKMRSETSRWSDYIRHSLIESVISRDVLLINPVEKPALLRQAFGLCLAHPAEILSYDKMVGQLQDAGNTTTIAQYLRMLENAFFISPLQKYSGNIIRQRSSSPKIIIMDNSLVNASTDKNYAEYMSDSSARGHIFENAVGTALYYLALEKGGRLFYWRERANEVDFVLQLGSKLAAIEVKSGLPGNSALSLKKFVSKYKEALPIIICGEPPVARDESGIKIIGAVTFFNDPLVIFK